MVSRIFQKKWSPDRPEMVALSRELQQKLQEQMSNWDILLTPSIHQYSKVADAVYRDLCRGTKRSYVTSYAVVLTNYSSKVIESIQRHLEQPAKRTLHSVLRSAWEAFRRW